MCMFAGLSIIQTLLFVLTIGILFFTIPLYEYIKKCRSPILFSYIQSLSVDEKTTQPIEEVTLYYTNRRETRLCIQNIGLLSKECKGDSLKKESVIWLSLNRDGIVLPHFVEARRRSCIRIQKPDEISLTHFYWIFEIDGLFYKADLHNKTYVQKINIE